MRRQSQQTTFLCVTTTEPFADKPYAERYNPAKGHPRTVTAAQWQKVRPFVVAAAKPLNHLAPASQVLFLRALTRLAAYIDGQGQPLSVEFCLRADVLTAYAASTRLGRAELGSLVRLAKEHGLPTSASLPVGVPRPAYAEPYTEDQIAALLRAAESLSTENRRLSATAVVLLGVGCGIVRQSAANVKACDVHYHGDDLFVAAEGRCAKVRSGYVEPLLELAAARPSGLLRGNLKADHVAVAVREWISGMPGVPTLFVDQLRAAYVCALLEDGVGLTDVLAWCGLQGAEALDSYLSHVEIRRTCDEFTRNSQ